MIGFCTKEYAVISHVVIEELPSSDIRSSPARVSRAATLDGGVSIDHAGFSHGDRTFAIKAKVTEDQFESLWSMHTTQTLLYCSTRNGVFLGAIQNLTENAGNLSLTFLVKDKESA